MTSDVFRDTLRGLKSWRRTPGSALLVILALGLSGGALLTLFSLSNALFWRELPVSRPQDLVGVSGTERRAQSWESIGLPASLFASLDRTQDVFQSFAAFINLQSTAVIDGVNQRLAIEGVTGRYFDALGVPLAFGRGVDAADVEGRLSVATISFRCWQTRFKADPNVVGQTFRLQGDLVTVIGVARAEFTGLEIGVPSDAWVPATLAPRLLNQPPNLIFFAALVGRLRPDVTLQQARQRLESLWSMAREEGAAAVAASLPEARADMLSVQPRIESAARGFSDVRVFYRSPLLLLVLSSVVTVGLCCVNLSGLLLARWSARELNLVIQAALGATKSRLVWQVVGESLALSALAVMLSAPVALWSAKLLALVLWNQPDVPPLDLGLDYRVAGVMAVLVTVIALLVSFLPAFRLWSTDFELIRGNRGGLPGRSVTRWGRRLSAAQVALSVPLLVTAWIVASNLHRLQGVNAGFSSDDVFVANLTNQAAVGPATAPAAYFVELAGAVSAVPGIDAAALSLSEPISGIFGDPSRKRVIGSDGREAKPFVEVISPDYFKTLGVTLVQGRDFTWSDDSAARDVAIISAQLATTLFPNSNPVGQRLRLMGRRERTSEIVGVAADATLAEPHEPNQMFVFTALLQEPANFLQLVSPAVLMKSRLPASAIDATARRTIAALGRDDLVESHSLHDTLSAVLLRERLMRMGSVYLAGLTTLLVFVGLYSVLNLGIARRVPEIGVRMALGASTRDIRLMVVGEALRTAVSGLLVGIPCAFLSGYLIASSLTLVGSHDMVAFCASVATILAVTVLSVLIPVRRASRVTPLEALNRQ